MSIIAQIAAEARRYASHYPKVSDGHNTFAIFAEWVERLPPESDRIQELLETNNRYLERARNVEADNRALEKDRDEWIERFHARDAQADRAERQCDELRARSDRGATLEQVAPGYLTAEQLADALECFWNAAIGNIRAQQYGDETSSMRTIGAMAEGFASVALRLREQGKSIPADADDELEYPESYYSDAESGADLPEAAVGDAKPEPQWTARLAHVDQRTPIEKQAAELVGAIEYLGAHPLLTDAQSAADLAMRTLGKWHDDGEPGACPPPPPPVRDVMDGDPFPARPGLRNVRPGGRTYDNQGGADWKGEGQ